MRQIPTASEKGASDTLHGGHRRIVGHEVADQFGGDEVRGCRMVRQVRKHGLAFESALFRVGLAKENLRAGLVQVVAEIEAAWSSARASSSPSTDGPSGDDLGEGRDIRLGVAAVDAEGV
jgi:hypothetical protein